jgi:UDP:flavonoid glycosyltransferase YjiC (YdhE family)
LKAAIRDLLGDREIRRKLAASAVEMPPDPGNESAAAVIKALLAGQG